MIRIITKNSIWVKGKPNEIKKALSFPANRKITLKEYIDTYLKP